MGRWDRIVNRVPYGLQIRLYTLVLHGDILVNRFWLDAIVSLVLIFKFPSAFRAFPHSNPSLPRSYHIAKYKSILCCGIYSDLSDKRVVINW